VADITTTPARILIVEDSPTQAQRLKYILERHGYEVTPTANGKLAIEAARANKPSLIISDILMPEMDGYELCEIIKSDPELHAVPVILVTTLSDPHDVIRALECRADNFIVKPYDDHYLLGRVRFVLMNDQIRNHDNTGGEVEIHFNEQRHRISADRFQILNLLLSTYEAAVRKNHELVSAKDALRTANVSLEAANRELEAFSYSVSHDLRAPLRAIDGFIGGVLADHAQGLSEKGRGLLDRAQKACHRMAQLIEDLLELSRVTRKDMRREDVDLGSLAKAVVSELQTIHPERTVRVAIEDGMVVNGDPRLLRAALENLLGNAWKFTAHCSDAVIDFGTKFQDGRKIYCIADNGAGFDMTYADKLFGAFQRLHSAEEFPGTGVGLATVQRIINRHGGRIWANATVGAGATFYFTL
jgi:signal transduction histidine kinase